MPKIAENRENPGFGGVWGPDPKIPENCLKLAKIGSKMVRKPENPEKKVRKFPEIRRKWQKNGIFSTVLRGAETTKMGKVPPDPPEFRWAFVRPRT